MFKDGMHMKEQLRRAGERLQRQEGRQFWMRSVPWSFAVLGTIIALDLVFRFEPGIRLTLLLLTLFGLIVLFFRTLYIGFVRQADLRRVARHLEEGDPSLGSSLINFLDLEATSQSPQTPETTRNLARYALENHTYQATGRDFPALVQLDPKKRTLKRFGWCLAAILAVIAVTWPISRAHILRLIDPYGGHPAYSMTTLTLVEPGDGSEPILYGAPARIQVTVKGHQPAQVDLVYWSPTEPDERYRIAMIDRGEDGFVQQIGSIEETLIIQAETPDGRTQTIQKRIDVHLTPKIESVTVEIEPPAYTGLPPVQRNYMFSEIRALPGSRVTLRARSNRPLNSGLIQLERPLEELSFETIKMEMTDHTNEVYGTFLVTQSAALHFTLLDTSGISSEQSPRGSISTVADRSPTVKVTQPGAISMLALDASVAVKVEASDDYGVSELRIHKAINGIFSPAETVQPETKARRLENEWTLNFSTVGVQPGDIVTYFAETIDNAPEPQLGRSEMIRIAAVSVEDYNRLLREQADMERISKKYTALQTEFAELMQAQQAIEDAASKLQEALKNAQTEEELSVINEQFGELRKNQEALNDALDSLAAKLASTIRDQPLYDVEKNFKERFEAEAQRLKDAAQANRDETKDTANETDLSEQIQAFATAAETQGDALNGGESDALDSAQKTMQDMALFHEMLKNFNRFASLAGEQEALAEKASAFDRPGELSRPDQLALRDLAGRQRQIADELELLIEKMRQDAENGETTFPQAAASSRDFASAIESARAPKLSRNSTNALLDGQGRNGAALASATSEAMNSLIGQCNGGMGQMSDELDRALSASKSGSSGQSFEQMMQNMQMRYSLPGGGLGQMSGSGKGAGSASGGYSVNSPNAPALVGNEQLPAEGDTSARSDASTGGPGDAVGGSDASKADAGAPGTLDGLEEVRRRSDSIRAESLFIEHDSIIDAYFQKITNPNP